MTSSNAVTSGIPVQTADRTMKFGRTTCADPVRSRGQSHPGLLDSRRVRRGNRPPPYDRECRVCAAHRRGRSILDVVVEIVHRGSELADRRARLVRDRPPYGRDFAAIQSWWKATPDRSAILTPTADTYAALLPPATIALADYGDLAHKWRPEQHTDLLSVAVAG